MKRRFPSGPRYFVVYMLFWALFCFCCITLRLFEDSGFNVLHVSDFWLGFVVGVCSFSELTLLFSIVLSRYGLLSK